MRTVKQGVLRLAGVPGLACDRHRAGLQPDRDAQAKNGGYSIFAGITDAIRAQMARGK